MLQSSKIALRPPDVAEDLGFQLFGRVEFALIAEPVEEADFERGGRGAVPFLQ